MFANPSVLLVWVLGRVTIYQKHFSSNEMKCLHLHSILMLANPCPSWMVGMVVNFNPHAG